MVDENMFQHNFLMLHWFTIYYISLICLKHILFTMVVVIIIIIQCLKIVTCIGAVGAYAAV